MATAAGGEIGGEGLVLGRNFDAYVRRERFPNLHHQVVNGRNLDRILKENAKAYLFRNTYLENMIASFHTCLHVATGLVKVNTEALIKFSVVSYLGLVAEFHKVRSAQDRLTFFKHLLSFISCDVLTTTFYVKCNDRLRKIIKVALRSGLEFQEECCGSHVETLNLGSFSFNVSLSSPTSFKLTALPSSLSREPTIPSHHRPVSPPAASVPLLPCCVFNFVPLSCPVWLANKPDLTFTPSETSTVYPTILVCKPALSISFVGLQSMFGFDAVFRKLQISRTSPRPLLRFGSQAGLSSGLFLIKALFIESRE
ncbi:MAG: hypothetical protein ACKFI0_00260 [Candidatus Hodgkinia cicadicola]